jgi:hypothetical protein
MQKYLPKCGVPQARSARIVEAATALSAGRHLCLAIVTLFLRNLALKDQTQSVATSDDSGGLYSSSYKPTLTPKQSHTCGLAEQSERNSPSPYTQTLQKAPDVLQDTSGRTRQQLSAIPCTQDGHQGSFSRRCRRVRRLLWLHRSPGTRSLLWRPSIFPERICVTLARVLLYRYAGAYFKESGNRDASRW